MADLVGKVLGPYKLEQQLGRGGMATVYRAYQESVRRYVAIKVMSQDIASDPGFVERFTREAQLIAALQHPHILPVIDYGQAEGIHYLVMNYISGGSLDDLMRKNQLSYDRVSDLLGQISSALDYAHKKGVIHRDFKPNNVLLDGEGNAYLTDFGIARLTTGESRLTVTGTVMGTPAYMSPEQGTGKTVDARADLYSLGVVLYEMICGRLPFSGETPASLIFQHAFQPPPPPTQFRADVPPAVVAVLIRAMAKNPDDRYQSGMELSRAFDEALRSKFEPAAARPVDENTIIGTPPRGSAATGTPPGTQLEGTFIGSPAPGTPAPGTIPPRPETGTPGQGWQTPGQRTPPPVPQPGAQQQPQRSPLPLIIGAIAVIALIAGIGGGALVINGRNQQATNDEFTKVAVLALSATKTPTSTPTETPLPTSTPTNPATATPNATDTAVAIRLTRLAQIELDATATAQALIQATQTQQANLAASQIAFQTQQAEFANQTATASSQPTSTRQPTRTPTRIPPSRTPAPTRTSPPSATPGSGGNSPTRTPVTAGNPYEIGTPEEIVGKLKSAGYVTDSNGVLWVAPNDLDIDKVSESNYYRWKTLGVGNLKNFVASAKFTWHGLADTSGCGLIARYSQPTSKTFRFHVFKIAAGKSYSVLTYMDTTDEVIKTGTVPVLYTNEGDTNQILIVGQGDEFNLLINGRFVTKVTMSTLDEGNVAVASITGSESGVECSFTDAWVYELASKGSGNITDGGGDTPEAIIKSLEGVGEISEDSAKLADQQALYTLTSQVSESDVFYRQALGDSTYRSFVFSTNVTWATSTRASTTSCGIHFYGTKGPDNLIAFFMYPDGSWNVFSYLQGKWSATAMTRGTSALIKTDKGDTNRVTVVASGGTATIYLNGQKLTRVTGITITRGNVGYYLGKGKDGGAESCGFSDAYVWNLTR